MNEDKKISLPEGLLMFFIVFFADLAEFLILLTLPIPIVGQALAVAGFFISLLAWLGIQLWLIMKGTRGAWFLAGGLLDTLANLMALDLPFVKTITLLITIYIANHPKIAATITGATLGKKT